MSDEKKYTERDLILAKREGFSKHCQHTCKVSKDFADREAAAEYPLPKVVRLRVVLDEERQEEWSLDRTVFMSRDSGSKFWTRAVGLVQVTPSRVRVWADLLANPTEEVDA